MMKCIVGLGNPGKKYDQTRHNIGFMVVDALSDALNIPLDNKKFKCDYGIGLVGSEKVMLVKPQTFMNLSGEGVRPLVDYYNIELEDVFVLYDDLDLSLGTLRLRQKGSGGGHNGIKSLNQHFGSEKYKRLRIGIDRPLPGESVSRYVLSTFRKDDAELLDKVIAQSTKASEAFISEPFNTVMNNFNGDVNE